MAIEIKKVDSKKLEREFLKLPWKIYENDDSWAPDLIMLLKDRLNRKKHPFFEYGKGEFFLAYKDGELVGRIAALSNPRHNQQYNDKIGFWGFFESINDQEVANALFDSATEWCKAQGFDTIRGPISAATNDEIGMLFENDDNGYRYLFMPHNPLYYMELCENYGMYKAKDLIAFHLDLTSEINPKVVNIANKIREKAEANGVTIRSLHKRQAKKDLKTILDIYQEAWSDNWGFVPFTEKEYNDSADSLLMIAEEKLIVIIEQDDKQIGMAVAVPDFMQITHSLRHLKKKPIWYQSLRQLLKLVGWLFLSRKNKFKRGRLFLAGIRPDYRGRGYDSFLYILPFQRGKEIGMTDAELSWELEDNTAINSAIEKMGGSAYRKYRIWDKAI